MLYWHLVFTLSTVCVCYPYKGVCAFKACLDSAVRACVCVYVVFNRCCGELHYAHVSSDCWGIKAGLEHLHWHSHI